MNDQQHRLRILFVLTFLSLTVLLSVPFGAKAQTEPIEFENLSISLWPEYDQPGVLVVYRAELNPETEFPAELTFQLPGHVEELHAVATEIQDGLIYVDEQLIKTSHVGDAFVVTFPTTSPRVQFEYYDATMLAKEGQERQLAFDFSAPYNIKIASFEVQHPFEAEAFSLTPAAEETFTGGNRLQYSTVLAPNNMTAGDHFELSATYRRDSDQLSLQALQPDIPPATVDIAAPAELSSGVSPYMGYGLIGAGVLILLTVGGYWWLKPKQTTPEPEATPAPPRRMSQRQRRQLRQKKAHNRLKKQGMVMAAQPAGAGTAAFCHRCGAAFQNDAAFCHACGAKRR